MMAAVQPFLSGAISKTCNVPNEATVEDIKELYFQGWKLGLKAVAIYRDGCKSSQPLTSTTPTAAAAAPPPSLEDLDLPEAQKLVATLQQRHGADVFAKVTMPTQRQRLPKNRAGTTQEATIGGTKLFLRTGEYPDGRVGEIFIDMHKEGAAFRAMANSFAIAVSLGLQYGVPLEEYVDQFTFVRFEPHGPVQDDAHVKHATSVLDYVFRHLGVNYLNRDDLAHIKPITPMRFGGRALVLPGEIVKPVTVSMLLPAAGDATQSATESESESEYMLSPELAVSKKSGAPFCDSCGHQTVRNATCWRCLNCGTSMGCS
jgi:ribonucleoside-diphosphate reductase alpha chain